MRWTRYLPLVTGLMLLVPAPGRAQNPGPAGPAAPARFESWQPAPAPGGAAGVRLAREDRPRGRRALIGGAIGAAVGVVFCTAVSTMADDSAGGGFSFCPLDSYLLIGGAGFVLGAAIGWLS